MDDAGLVAFWIDGPDRNGPLGYGVTAFSVEDAIAIIERSGYHLPDDRRNLHVKPDVKPAELEHEYIRDHMGPIVVRGLWYPFRYVGCGAE